jgi:RecA/RadA recombinase
MMAGENVTFDRVTGTESTGENLCLDLSVPIGHHYVANTHISHNSTLAMHQCERELREHPNRVVTYLDYERSTAQAYCKNMGLLDYGDRFALLNPDSLEDSDTMLNDLFKLKIFPSIVVVDSIPAMIPSAFFGRDMSNAPQVGLQARLLGELLSKWVKWAGDYGITFVLINQTRTFIDMSGGIETNIRRARIVKGSGEKESEDTPGGNAVKFYSSMRIRLQPKKISYATVFNPMAGMEQQVPVANVVMSFCKKNKCAPPFKSGIFFIEYGKGIDNVRTMLELAKAQKIISGSGGFKLELPSGGKIFSRKELDFIDKLRASEEGQQTLRGLLQWDQVDRLTSEVLGISTVDLEDDDVGEMDTGEDLLMAGVTVEKIEEQPSLAHQADVIGLVEKLSGGRVGFKGNYEGAEQVRSNSLVNLNKKLSQRDQKEIQETVEAKKTLIQESIAEDYQEVPVAETPPPQEETPNTTALEALQQGATHGHPATPGTPEQS